MKQIEYVIETLAPVTFAEKNNESTLYNTRKYIPGSIFRGMLADRFIRENNLVNAHEDENFYNIFLSGKVRFLPAYPIGRENRDGFEPYVLPLSFMKSKDGKELRDIAGEAKIETGFKKMTGFALKKDNDIYKVNVDTQIEFHMARSSEDERIHGSSQNGRVFNYEYIEPYQYFKGFIIADDDMADKVENELKMKKIYIGRSRSVQYGECSVCLVKVTDCTAQKINTADRLYLYMYTPYIPQNEWQRTDCVAEDLYRTINNKLEEKGILCKIEAPKNRKIFAATEEYSGYVGVWKVRRERKAAISAGSLIEIKLTKNDVDTIKILSEILYGGLGDRTQEGFGQFRLYQPFETLSLKELEDAEDKGYKLSDEVKKQAGKIIKECIFAEIKKQAVNDGDKKLELHSKSKTTLNRIENLMNSSKSKDVIQNKIRAFNKTAIENLQNMFIGRDNLYDILTESINVKLPYKDIKWETKLGLDTQNLNLVEKMKNDLDRDVFIVDEDSLYREYFLWFIRHAKKVIKEKEQI